MTSKFRSRLLRTLLIALVAIVLICFSLSSIVSPLIGNRIRAQIQTRLRAEFRYDSLRYQFPYTVVVKKAQIITDQSLGQFELIGVERLELTLAKLPLGRGPLVVKALKLKGPSVHVVRGDGGVIGSEKLIRSDAERAANPPKYKLSEIFELRQVSISDGKITYEDHRDASHGSMIFGGINVDLGVIPQTGSVYSYQLKARNLPHMTLDAGGTMDIDALVLNLSQLAMKLQVRESGDAASLPPNVQKVIEDFGIRGTVDLNGVAMMPLRDLGSATFSADLSLSDGRMTESRGRIDRLDVQLHADARDGQTSVQFNQLEANTEATQLKIEPFAVRISRDGWTAADIKGALTAAVRGPSTRRARVDGNQLLAGAINLSGQAHGNLNSKPDYDLALQLHDLAFWPKNFPGPVDKLNGEIHIKPQSIETAHLEGLILTGRAVASGKVDLAKPMRYEGTLSAEAIDLHELSLWYVVPNTKQINLSGKANFSTKVSGLVPVHGLKIRDSIAASGEVEITQGQLWAIPVLDGIARQAHIDPSGLTVSEAAGVFEIKDRVVTLKSAALNSPVLGLQGKGTVGFDQQANLEIIAAPLGDWKKQIQGTHIPLLSNMAGEVAGGIQKLVGTATSNLLYQFQVTGRLSEPNIKAVPAPMLTDGAANVFGKMLKEAKAHDLLDEVKQQK